MKIFKIILICSISTFIFSACESANSEKKSIDKIDWKSQLNNKLSEFGHRNWILIVDKAYPSQNSEGVITIDTHEDLLDVLNYSLKQIDSSTHVKPIIYTDKELNYITPQQVSNINKYRSDLKATMGSNQPKVMLHDSVFVNIDKASKLFKVLVLKTNATIPYSSIFLQLDCKYWTAEKEMELRAAMKELN